jgi:hypothetical protein
MVLQGFEAIDWQIDQIGNYKQQIRNIFHQLHRNDYSQFLLSPKNYTSTSFIRHLPLIFL